MENKYVNLVDAIDVPDDEYNESRLSWLAWNVLKVPRPAKHYSGEDDLYEFEDYENALEDAMNIASDIREVETEILREKESLILSRDSLKDAEQDYRELHDLIYDAHCLMEDKKEEAISLLWDIVPDADDEPLNDNEFFRKCKQIQKTFSEHITAMDEYESNRFWQGEKYEERKEILEEIYGLESSIESKEGELKSLLEGQEEHLKVLRHRLPYPAILYHEFAKEIEREELSTDGLFKEALHIATEQRRINNYNKTRK